MMREFIKDVYHVICLFRGHTWVTTIDSRFRACRFCGWAERLIIKEGRQDMNFELFLRWLGGVHPEVKLLDWQIEVAKLFLNQPRAAGKTFLLNILKEYEQTPKIK
jgi:hypothetical protein